MEVCFIDRNLWIGAYVNMGGNLVHRQKVKAMSIRKYCLNPLHRHNVRAMNRDNYLRNHEHKICVTAGNKLKGQERKLKSEEFNFAMERFLAKVKDFECCVSHRYLFRHQVLHCKRHDYNNNTVMASLADKCISEDYLHKCCKDWVLPCRWLDTVRSQCWICFSCHVQISKGEV